jgi:hypothetical protein
VARRYDPDDDQIQVRRHFRIMVFLVVMAVVGVLYIAQHFIVKYW